MELGDFKLHLISDGTFRLDGGAMFGVVPKSLWERTTPADEKNRIQLALNCLLVQTGDQNILIDTGCGHKYSAKELSIYEIRHEKEVLQELKALGLAADDISIVINTHLHFDHCGGNTRLEGDRVVPTFPQATYIAGRREMEDAQSPNERTRATYFAHNWEPLAESGQLKISDGNEEVVPGVGLVSTPGHTMGHQSVKIQSGGQTLFYIADLCPTAAHVPLPWIMGYDLYPMTTLETRHSIYSQAAREEWLLFFEHDSRVPCGYLQEKEGKYTLQPREWEF